MKLLRLAPWADSYDFWIAAGFCFIPVLIWVFLGYKASKSGSRMFNFAKMEWEYSDKNVPIYKTGYFIFGMLWLVLGAIMFLLIGSDRWDLWFIK